MKFINLWLIILTILTSPGIVLAQQPSADVLLAKEEAEEVEVDEKDEEVEEDEEDEEVEEVEEEVKEPTPEEIARLKKLAEADKLYLAGKKIAAANIYRQVKPRWEIEKAGTDSQEIPDTFEDPAQLSPGGKVYWRIYQQGKKQGLQSKIFTPLKLLTSKQPEFIPGHLKYAEELKNNDQEEAALKVLEQAVNRYPSESKLLKAKINADIAAERWLEASVAARQFAAFNSEQTEAAEFKLLADQYLEEYKSQLRSKLTWNAIGNVLAGTLGFVLTGNLFGPISAVETTALLLRGETAIGESTAKQAKKQLPLLEDESVNQYIQELGKKIIKAAGRDDFNYEFYVVLDNNINAFALPGGKVFVHTGAILETDSEAELAGLLAHEISHAVLSHGFQLVTQGNLTANVVSNIPYVGGTATNLIVLNYSRGMERQADILGTRILVASDYAADGVRNLMQKLEESHSKEDNSRPPAWLSTHPDTSDRIGYMEKLIVDNHFNRYAYEGVTRHQEVKKTVRQLWQEYKACMKKESQDNINAAKKCAGNTEEEGEKTPEE